MVTPSALISRHCWEHLTTSEQVENAVSFLCQHHWIKVKEVNTGFRPSRIIKINPSLFRCL
ncbi:hypothetical protein EBR43_00695 [bacterium]|nr:hypothetical protein [bacterium]NBW56306.1 hypothetical protein [bacterium]NBX72471.1 hypothetical protein [bacterium]